MAEALGLAASVLAVLELTSKLLSLGYEYIRSAKDAPEDLRSLVDELNSLNTVLVSLESYFRDQKKPQLPALQAFGQKGPLHGCKLALQRLLAKLGPKEDFRGKTKRLKWFFEKEETFQHIERIQRHVRLFNLALTVDHL